LFGVLHGEAFGCQLTEDQGGEGQRGGDEQDGHGFGEPVEDAQRWYTPKVDIRMDLLVPTDTVTHCPYKGQAQYWSARVGDRLVPDLAWSYRTPLPESQKIAGLVAFPDERVDLVIDGEPRQRPATKFS